MECRFYKWVDRHFLFGQICLKICANKKRRGESDLSTSSFVLGVCSVFSRRNQCPKLRTPLRAGFRRPSLWLSDTCEYLNHLGKSKITPGQALNQSN